MKVLILLNRYFENDSRVHRCAKTLADEGNSVLLIAKARADLPAQETRGNYKVIRVLADLPAKSRSSRGRSFSLTASYFRIKEASKKVKGMLPVVVLLKNVLQSRFGAKKVFDVFIKPKITQKAVSRRNWKKAEKLWVSKTIRWNSKHRDDYRTAAAEERENRAFSQRIRQYERFAQVALEIARDFSPDLVHANDFDTLFAAESIQEELDVPFVYDAHELWSERNRLAFVSGSFEADWERLYEKTGMHRAAKSITVCESIADYMMEQYGIPRPIVVRNTPERRNDVQSARFDLRSELKIAESDFLCVYVGLVTFGRGLEDILNALALLPSEIKFLTLGSFHSGFQKKFAERIHELKLQNRVFHYGPVAPEQIANTIKDCDLSLTTMNRISLSNSFALPNKVFESLQAQLPILGPDSVEFIRLTSQFHCGVTYKDGNAQDLSRRILHFYRNREQLESYRVGAAKAAQELVWENEKEKLLEVYRFPFNTLKKSREMQCVELQAL